jgi:choline dehydrogenase
MRKYFIQIENDHSVPQGTAGHGFEGFLDITVNDQELLHNQSQAQEVLRATATQFGEDPDKIFELIQKDLNNDSPDRDNQTGIFGFPTHRDPRGRRASAHNIIVATANATSKLNVRLNSLVTKVLFDTTSTTPKAIGVEYLAGKSLYGADPRYNASTTAPTLQAFARKEVIVSGGVFNSPQILKLSGIGPKAELDKFGIPVLVDLPGVGTNMQDNNEFGVISTAAQNFTTLAPTCTFGAPGDPCLAAWEEGTGVYAQGALDAIMFKSSNATERDFFIWGTPGGYRGYWPAETVNEVPLDPPNSFGFAIIKFHPQGHGGTVNLVSNNPRDVPDINFHFFEGTGEADLEAFAEAVEFGRKVYDQVSPPLGPFTENFPCDGNQDCDVKNVVKTQTWSHHATSTNAIGADSDPMAVLDSSFRVRGTTGLRVVDGSAFPRTPGAFPVVPTFMMSAKASEVILSETWP